MAEHGRIQNDEIKKKKPSTTLFPTPPLTTNCLSHICNAVFAGVPLGKLLSPVSRLNSRLRERGGASAAHQKNTYGLR